jgi:hypothetical protein
LIFGEYTRRVRVFGAVVPSAGVLHVFTPQTGRLLANCPFDDRLGEILSYSCEVSSLGLPRRNNGMTLKWHNDLFDHRIGRIGSAIV